MYNTKPLRIILILGKKNEKLILKKLYENGMTGAQSKELIEQTVDPMSKRDDIVSTIHTLKPFSPAFSFFLCFSISFKARKIKTDS